MKIKILVLLVAVLAIAAIGFAQEKAPVPQATQAVKAPVAEPVAVGIYVTKDANQAKGAPLNKAKLDVDETVTVYAKGKGAKGEWLALPADATVNWKTTSKYIEINPATGESATIKVLKKLPAPVHVTATATFKDGKKHMARFFIFPKEVVKKAAPKPKEAPKPQAEPAPQGK